MALVFVAGLVLQCGTGTAHAEPSNAADPGAVFSIEEVPLSAEDVGPTTANPGPRSSLPQSEASVGTAQDSPSVGQSYDVDADALPDDGTTAPTPVSDSPSITFSECADRIESRTADGWAKNHFQWCKLKGYRLVEEDAQTGNERGAVAVTLGLFGYSNNRNRVTYFSYTLKGLRHSGSMIGRSFEFQIGGRSCSQAAAAPYQRRLASGINDGITADNGCSVSSAVGSTWRSEADWKLANAFVGQDLTSVGGRQPDLTGRPKIAGAINVYEAGLYVTGTGLTVTYSPSQSFFRCDSASYINLGANSYPEGCVFQVDANLQYDLNNPKSYEAVQHIDEAQHNPGNTKPIVAGKVVPGERASGAPLTRNFYGRQGTAGRVQAVCNQYWPGYSTETPRKDCDEYPFASTYENAIYAPNGYSAKAVIATQNRSGGGQLNAFYVRDRILEEDRYFVEVVNSGTVNN